MPVLWIVLIVLALAVAGFLLGRTRAVASARGDARRLHSLPSFHGWLVALYTAVPALALLVLWLLVQPLVLERQVLADVPKVAAADAGARSLVVDEIRRIAAGLDRAVERGVITASEASDRALDAAGLRNRLAAAGVALGTDVDADALTAAQAWRSATGWGSLGMTVAVLGLAVAGFLSAHARIAQDFRARNSVERFVQGILIAAATVAIATTAAIVLSLVFESANFFRQYPWQSFFFSLTWSPNFHGNSELGIIPLLWGTLYISLVALLVAVPLGIYAAIYMSEYAGPRMRSIAKPVLEVLAGIPTIVYGLFALLTVGPFLRDAIAQPLGLGNSGSSVMTAGVVMGIMLIPYVSSLSDDIMNAVPQALRDGSYGLGATRSETIRQVVLPAALPGIVGAVLMAASRAIGETMIVVLGAGAAAQMSLNPFEAMTTVTVKIVSQLTGDTDFAAPETLVAFALGLTLFIMTLGLNILALHIVRKYREQYE